MDFDKLSRRDFLKKTTVLAVGVASVTLFSGLVNANVTYPHLQRTDCRYENQSPCEESQSDIDGVVITTYHCTVDCVKQGGVIGTVIRANFAAECDEHGEVDTGFLPRGFGQGSGLNLCDRSRVY